MNSPYGAANRNNNGSSNSNGPDPSGFPLDNLSPEEITLAAAVFAIAIGESMDQEDASLLAFFLSTLSSNLGLFLEKRRRDVEAIEAEPPFPGEL